MNLIAFTENIKNNNENVFTFYAPKGSNYTKIMTAIENELIDPKTDRERTLVISRLLEHMATIDFNIAAYLFVAYVEPFSERAVVFCQPFVVDITEARYIWFKYPILSIVDDDSLDEVQIENIEMD